MTTNISDVAREEMLRRIRGALKHVPADEQPADVAVTREYLHQSTASRKEIIDLFVENVRDYKAIVHELTQKELPARIAKSLSDRGIKRLVVPSDLPRAWLSKVSRIDVLPDNQLAQDTIEHTDGVLTGCALGIAQTGTIVLDSGQYQGRRIISLLPDYHLCIVMTSQVVGIVPEAITQLSAAASEKRRPITFISGPSATSDIELNRVEGVHGPRTLEVLVVT